MPKPKTKTELIDLSQSKYKELIKLISSYDEDSRNLEFKAGTLNRNIKDVVMHLHHWHLMLEDWYETGEKGLKPDMPAKGFTWQTLPLLNQQIWEQSQQTNLDQALKLLSKSYQTLQGIIKENDEDDLFEKKKLFWTGSTSLAAYLIMNTCSHYNWAIKLIKKSMKHQK